MQMCNRLGYRQRGFSLLRLLQSFYRLFASLFLAIWAKKNWGDDLKNNTICYSTAVVKYRRVQLKIDDHLSASKTTKLSSHSQPQRTPQWSYAWYPVLKETLETETKQTIRYRIWKIRRELGETFNILVW